MTKPRQSALDSLPVTTRAVPKTTWLTVYWDEWVRVVGGDPTGGELAQRMKRLEKKHGRDKVIAHFTNYLKQVDPMYASLKRFEETFAQHGTEATIGRPSQNRAVAEQLKRRLAGG